MFNLILPMGAGPAWFLGGQFRDLESLGKNNEKNWSQIKKEEDTNKGYKITTQKNRRIKA